MRRVLQFVHIKAKHRAPDASLNKWFFACDAIGGTHGNRIYHRNLTDDMVSWALKFTAKAMGLNPMDYSSHSARRGGVTSLRSEKFSEDDTQHVSGHKSKSAFRCYDRSVVTYGALSTEADIDEGAKVQRLRNLFASMRLEHLKSGHQEDEL